VVEGWPQIISSQSQHFTLPKTGQVPLFFDPGPGACLGIAVSYKFFIKFFLLSI